MYGTLGGVAGADQVTLTESNLPAHQHTNTTLAAAGAHTHSYGPSTAAGSHEHKSDVAAKQVGSYNGWHQSGKLWWGVTGKFNDAETDSSGSHRHSLATNSSGAHTHTLVTDGGPGTSQAINVRNPYIALHWIIKG